MGSSARFGGFLLPHFEASFLGESDPRLFVALLWSGRILRRESVKFALS